MAAKNAHEKRIIHPFLVVALIAALSVIPAGRATAQAFRVLNGVRPKNKKQQQFGTKPLLSTGSALARSARFL